MKRLRRSGYATEGTAAQRRLLSLLRRVRHENVAPVLDLTFDEPEETYVVTTEHVDGLDLLTYARDVAPELTADLVAQVLRGLAHVHGWGLVHHGLKPSNILVAATPEGPRPRIVDFALVAGGPIAADGVPDPRRIAYIAPEVLAGEDGDARSDLYSLGMILWEILEGELPFADSEDAESVISWHKGERPHSRPHGELGHLVSRLVDPHPGRRCRSAAEALRVLSADAGRVFFHDTGDPGECLLTGRFVGRESVMQQLEDVAQRVFRGESGGVFLIEGARGMGKTRVLEELGVMAQLSGVRVVRPTAGTARPLGALRDVLRDLVGALGPEHAAVQCAAPTLASLLPDLIAVEEPRPAWDECDAEPRCDDLAAFFSAAGEARPFLVLIDDLHAVDESSLDLLFDLSRRLTGAPVMMVGTLREECCDSDHPLARWLAAGAREILTLTPLDPPAIEQLVAGAFALPGEVREISEMVVRLTGGVPLFVEALLRSLVEGEPLAFTDDGRLGPGAEGGPSAGERAARLVVRRLERLPPDARRVAEAMTVFEGATGCTLLAAVAELATDAVEGAVRSLESEDVVSTELGPDETLVRWRSDLFRDAIRKDVDEETSRTLHDRAVDHLESSGGIAPAEIAWHALRGTRPHRYLEHARAAVQEAVSMHDEHQGRRLLERALEVARRIGENAQARELAMELVDVLERLGDSDGAAAHLRELAVERPDDAATLARLAGLLKESGQHEEAESVLERANAAVRETDDRLLRSRIARGRAECLIRRHRHDEARVCLNDALELVAQDGPDSELARVHAALGLACWFANDRDGALRHHQESQRHYLAAKDRLGSAISHVNIGLVLWTRGRMSDALECFRRSEEIARRASHYRILGTALHNRGLAELELGRLADARRTIRTSLHMRERLGDDAGAARTLVNLGVLHLRLGSHETARELLLDAVERRRRSDDGPGLANALVNVAELHRELGDRVGAEESAREALDLAMQLGDAAVVAEALVVNAKIALHNGQPDAAAESARRARDLWDRLSQSMDAVEAELVLARIDRLRGNVADARGRVARCLRILRGSGHARLVVMARREAGRLCDGVGALRAAHELARTCGLAELRWRCASELGQALLSRGQHVNAASVLRDAMEEIRRLHGDLSIGRRATWLGDPEKEAARAAFEEAMQKIGEDGRS